MILLGIDIGGTAVKLGVVEAQSGNLLCQEEHAVDFDGYQTPILTTVVQRTEALLAGMETKPAGIGISATGQVEVEQGCVAGTCGNLPGWEDVPLKAVFEERFSLPVAVMNDANCALLGEHWMGGARDVRNAVMVTLGTGVGGGVLAEGEILTGSRGFAGELGHMLYCAGGLPCTCGNRGCWEQYASVTALLREARKHTGAQALNGVTFFERVREGDANMATVLQPWIQSVAVGLIGLVHLFNPQLVLLGGGISAQDRHFITPLREQVMAGVMPRYREGLCLETARLGNMAGVVGAVRQWLKTYAAV